MTPSLPKRSLRDLTTFAGVGLSLLVGSTGAAAGPTYKCIIDGRTVFQQTGCPANAQPDPPKVASAPAAATSAAPATARSSSGAASRSSVTASRAGAASSVQVNIPRK